MTVSAKHSVIKKASQREQYSKFLPYLYEHPKEKGRYLLTDDSEGYIWECTPHRLPSPQALRNLKALLAQQFPDGSVLQFIIYADPSVDHLLNTYSNAKDTTNSVLQSVIKEKIKYLKETTVGHKKLSKIPTRNYRMFVTLKNTEELDELFVDSVSASLESNGFNPQRTSSESLLHLLRKIFNGMHEPQVTSKSPAFPLNKQIIKAENPIIINDGYISLGEKQYASVITPKTLRKNKFDPFDYNKLFGGIDGLQDDSTQYLTPYLYTVNIIFGRASKAVNQKGAILEKQKMVAKASRKLTKYIQEFDWVLDITEDEKCVDVIPSLVVFADCPEKLTKAVTRITTQWSNADFMMQTENKILSSMFIVSLPFGLYNKQQNMQTLDRHFPLPISIATILIPFTGDFSTGSKPSLIFTGRKGGIITLDLWDKRADSRNLQITAPTGAGKSFLTNEILQAYGAESALLRGIDIGGSYKKFCSLVNGRFIEYGKEDIVTNPFHQTGNGEDSEQAFETTCQILKQMIFSGSNTLSESQNTLIKSAARHTIQSGDIINGIDSVQNYLNNFTKYATDEEKQFKAADQLAKELAFNIKDYTSTGLYGRFFNGKNNFNISDEPNVFVELEMLKNQPQLLSVIAVQLFDSITQDLYLSKDNERRFILVDELASLIATGNDLFKQIISKVVEEAFRRIRKYNGAMGIVMQSIQDLEALGPLGKVINTNTPYKFFLRGDVYSSMYETPFLSNVHGMDRRLLENLKNNKPYYSEFFLSTPYGQGVCRLSVPDFQYYVNNTEKELVYEYNQLVKSGLTPLEALQKQASKELR